MPINDLKKQMEDIFEELSREALQSEEFGKYTPLKEFVRLVRLLTKTHTCILTFVNLSKEEVVRIASSSLNKDFEDYLDKRRIIKLDTSKGVGVSFEIASRGKEFQTNKLQIKGEA